MKRLLLLTFAAGSLVALGDTRIAPRALAQAVTNAVIDPRMYQDLRWRSIGPHRGGRSTAAAGVRTQPGVFYMGATGGGVWKTENYGITWTPISDGQMATGSIGAIDVSDSNPNVIYVGTGSEAIRSNVILGRGVYRTKDGGKTWQKVLFLNDQTGAVSVAINWTNPNEVYAGAWRGQRRPWTIISGGPAAEGGVYKTTDGGDHWARASNGFPDDLIGKVWVDVAQSNPKVLYAQIEAKGSKGGLYRSTDSGANWTLV